MRKTFTGKSLLCIFTSVCLSLQSVPYTSFAQGEGTWKQENGTWKYYDSANNLLKSWVQIKDAWYYFDPVTGAMKTGWFKDANGNWYFLSTAEDASQGQMLKSWQVVDEYDYFFYKDGSLAVNTTTPDGYTLNAEGRIVDKDGKVQKSKKPGYSSVKPVTNATQNKSAKASGGFGSSSGSGSFGGSGGSGSSLTSNDSKASLPTEGNTKQDTTTDNTVKEDKAFNNSQLEDKQQNGNISSNEHIAGNIQKDNKAFVEDKKVAEDKAITEDKKVAKDKAIVEDKKTLEDNKAVEDRKDSSVAENKQNSVKPAEDKKEDTASKKPDATSSASIERWRQKYIAEGKDPDAYKKPKKEDKAEDKKAAV